MDMIKKKFLKWGYMFLVICLFLLLVFCWANARNMYREDVKPYSTYKITQQKPEAQQRVHRVGNVNFCITNWGFFGSQSRELYESVGGCFNPNPTEERPAPSFEMPPNSGLEYLFQGGLWIGAIVEGPTKVETLVTVACDGWFWIYEMAPPIGEEGAIIERSNRPGSSCFDLSAVSEQDIIAHFADTANAPLTQQPITNDWDGRPHIPIGVAITQKSYSWSYEYAKDFVLIDYVIKNVNETKSINNMWIGIYIDADVSHTSESPYANEAGAQDDIAGYVDSVETLRGWTKIHTAYIADNDGQPYNNVFTSKSPTGVSGVRVVKAPPGVGTYFNWYISHQEGYPKDWGPWKEASKAEWERINPYKSGDKFPNSVLGTPGGDISKYFILQNREWDYDQIFTDVWVKDHPNDGWLAPESQVNTKDLANGFDTRYLYSFGPFPPIAPGDSITLTIGYIGGEDFHIDPQNRSANLDSRPYEYYKKLNFDNFATNSSWAAWVYDNPLPGEDTGDGIPDFKGPPPPEPPTLTFESSTGKVKIKWNGKRTEKSKDSFTYVQDFEGYKVYMSKTGQDYILLGSFDKENNFQVNKLNRIMFPRKWEWIEASVPLDSLKKLYVIPPIGDDPTVFTRNNPYVYASAVPLIFYNMIKDSSVCIVDTCYYPDCPVSCPPCESIWATCFQAIDTLYKVEMGDSLFFEKQSWNLGLRSIRADTLYADSVERGLISDTIEDRYWDYEFEVTDLLPSQPYYFAVTTFDYGNPPTNVPPLESGKSINAQLVYPVDPAPVVQDQKKEVIVYPNPYKISEDYVRQGSEPGYSIYDRRLHFLNLPAKCTIRIYTLDGDLVRTIEHNKDENDPTATYDSWELISRNTQAVVSGIYLYSIESEGKNQVGKFVIIK
jgi:hypothetical protein